MLFLSSILVFALAHLDSPAAEALTADYANNVLNVVVQRPGDLLSANMPFRLVVGPDPADKAAAEAAIAAVATSMPTRVRSFFEGRKLMAPLTQWLLRRCHPSVDDDMSYLKPAAHPAVWRTRDFDLSRLATASRALSEHNIPLSVALRPVYEEYAPAPIRRAVPGIDYPDPRPEATFETPFGIGIVLRAPEAMRKFRFRAQGSPVHDGKVSFKWIGASVGAYQGKKELSPERGFGEVVVNWRAVRGRQDVLVFARYDDGPWGPPSVISFLVVPNERRQFGQNGQIESITYLRAGSVVPQLYQNKPWRDEYDCDALGNLTGFSRFREGMFRGEPFSMDGEVIVETYPNGQPKISNKVRYFTRTDDPLTLDYEVLDEEISHPNREFVPRDRGEFARREALRSNRSRFRLD